MAHTNHVGTETNKLHPLIKSFKKRQRWEYVQYFDLTVPLLATFYALHQGKNPLGLLCDICAFSAQI
jgi:hypothetical protein